MLRWFPLILAIAAGCKPGYDPDDLVRIAIEPGAVLITEKGERVDLLVAGYDAKGNRYELDKRKELSWQSLDPKDVAVDDKGRAEAKSAAGSAQVVVKAHGLTSPPALVTVAKPAKDAYLFQDDQVVEVALLDETLSWGIGYPYRVTLADLDQPPKKGEVLVPRESLPIAGRITAVKTRGDTVDVDLEVVRFNELFQTFSLDEEIALSPDNLVFDEGTEDVYDIVRGDDGWIELIARDGGARAAGAVLGTSAWQLECETRGDIPEIQLPKPTIKLNPELILQVKQDGWNLEKMLVTGKMGSELKFAPKVKARFGGGVSCTKQFGVITVPLGALGAIYGPGVPIGVGFELSGTATLADAGVTVEAKPSYRATVGLDCVTGNCNVVANGELDDGNPTITFNWPDIDSDFQIQASAHGFAWATARLGPGPALAWAPMSVQHALSFEAFEVKAGMEQAGDFKLATGQVEDAAYASSYALKAKFYAGGKTNFAEPDYDPPIEQLADILGISLASVKLELEEPYAASPTGSWDWSSVELEAGVPVTVPITMEDVTYLGLQNIDAVRVYRVDTSYGDPILTTEALIDRTSDGQREYLFQWTPTVLDVDQPPVFAAFVDTTLLPILPLEIASDGRGYPRGKGTIFVQVYGERRWQGYPTMSLASINPTSGSTTVLTPEGTYADAILVPPFGSYAFFGGYVADGSTQGLYAVPVSGGTVIDAAPGHPWTRISYACGASADGTVIAMGGQNAAGTNALLFTDGQGTFWDVPAPQNCGNLDPLGDRITGTVNPNCVVLDTSTGAETTFTDYQSPFRCESPRFSPDGTKVAWVERDGGTNTYKILVANPDGTGQTEAYTYNDADATNWGPIVWAPDSTRIATADWDAAANKQQLTIVSATGGPRVETPLNAEWYWMDWAPNSQKLYLGTWSPVNGVYEVGADGTGLRQVATLTNEPNGLWVR